MSCDSVLLKGISVFELLHDDDRDELAKVVDVSTLKVGQTLFEAGEPGDSMFIVRSGSIELYI